jgi:hypothetical protein
VDLKDIPDEGKVLPKAGIVTPIGTGSGIVSHLFRMNTSHSNMDAQEQATPMANLWSTIRRHSHAEFLSTNTRGKSILDIGEDKKSHANSLGYALTLPNKPDSLDLLPYFLCFTRHEGKYTHHRASQSIKEHGGWHPVQRLFYSTLHRRDFEYQKLVVLLCTRKQRQLLVQPHLHSANGNGASDFGTLDTVFIPFKQGIVQECGLCGHLRCHFCSAVVPQRTVIFANDV